MDVCNTQGEEERIIVSKSHEKEDGRFRMAKKMKWGDLWFKS